MRMPGTAEGHLPSNEAHGWFKRWSEEKR